MAGCRSIKKKGGYNNTSSPAKLHKFAKWSCNGLKTESQV